MDPPWSPRYEKLRVVWDFAREEVGMHERRYLQMLAASPSGAFAVYASVMLEKIPPAFGLLFGTLLLAAAGYVHLLIRRLPRRLHGAMLNTLSAIDNLMSREEA